MISAPIGIEKSGTKNESDARGGRPSARNKSWLESFPRRDGQAGKSLSDAAAVAFQAPSVLLFSNERYAASAGLHIRIKSKKSFGQILSQSGLLSSS